MTNDERDTELEYEQEDSQNNESRRGSGIIFDFERLEHRGETRTSLTDLYGYPVFSETFSQQVSQFHVRQRRELEQMRRQVFLGEPVADLDLMAIFVSVMDAEPQMIIQAEPPPIATNDSPFLMLGFAAFGMALACILFIVLGKVKRKRSSL